ncbi:MAG: hypothetical protein AB7V23_16770, partial [Candidatus Nanopelagicales bacterium]
MTPTGRDNGLPRAARYVALVDVDPPVADHVLDLLRDAGVPALAEPVVGEVGTASRATTPPKRPTERVHVDHDHVELAQTVVAEALPALRADFHADAARREDAADAARSRADDLDPDQVDSLFAGIVAGWGTTGSDPVPRWSVLEDADEPEGQAPDAQRPPLSSRLVRRSPEPAPAAPDPLEDHDDHFVPPPPPPLPEADRVTRLAWAALLGGPTLIILAALFGIGLESWVTLLALVSFLGGFATLVAR